jgi:hypothetical protein
MEIILRTSRVVPENVLATLMAAAISGKLTPEMLESYGFQAPARVRVADTIITLCYDNDGTLTIHS